MKILLATDGSSCSDAALDALCARPWPEKSEVCVLSVAAPPPYLEEPLFAAGAACGRVFEEERERAGRDASRVARAIRRRAPALSVVAKSVAGTPAASILEEAAKFGADLILVGSHGRSAAARFLLGSVSNAVALHAPCSVEVVRKPAPAAIRAGGGGSRVGRGRSPRPSGRDGQ
ncbi:MAG: universal stress protein [Thermoanaerobaculia bacterium]